MSVNLEETIQPHGGSLINCFVQQEELNSLKEEAKYLSSIVVSRRVLCDVEMIGIGAFSPLSGFTHRKDYISIVENMRLSNGLLWPIPITLQLTRDGYNEIKTKNRIALRNEINEVIAILSVEDIFEPNLEKEALLVFKTKDEKHPAVKYLFEAGDYCLAGSIKVLKHTYTDFPEYNLMPSKTRVLFREKGWKRIVAFQTRNPVHRAHEYLLKVALETVDGLMLHPTMGETKEDDIPQDVRMKCYKTILENYFPRDRVLLVIMPASMRYAGPREAILHAIIRKNYGCTHFIVGRDHAGVGNYYGTYDAQKIFDEFTQDDLKISIIFFEHSFYCKACGEISSYKTCPHDSSNHLILSGTKVREMLKRGEMLPEEFTRPEIAKILKESMVRGQTPQGV